MAHRCRLFSPGGVFTGLGIVVLLAGGGNWFQWRHGLVTLGLYALAFQIVLSGLLTSGINDLSGGDRRHRADVSARPISSRRLVDFYRQSFLPALLLGFGLGVSLTAFAVGAFHETGLEPDFLLERFGMHRSEAALGVVLILGAAFLWWRGGSSYFGWVIGVGLASVFGQAVFGTGTNVVETVLGWGVLVGVLCLLRLLALGGVRVGHLIFRPHQPREAR
jgi:hypothetical protein